MTVDSVQLLQDLIRCPSVTPAEGGAITLLENLLKQHGFECHRLTFSDKDTPDIENLYAVRGSDGPHISFAGHTDVVPIGDAAAWSFDPFGGAIIEGYVCGRGASDMKSGVAASVAAVLNYLEKNSPAGKISFIITGDEEAVAVNGTVKIIEWLEKRGEKIDFCLLGEPSSREKLGDTIKIGRRGTLTGYLTVTGKQGHVAYPHLADNPVPRLLKLLTALDALKLDEGTADFQPSNLEIVNIDIGNTADNVIPAKARATFNLRFNDRWDGKTLQQKIRETLEATGLSYDLAFHLGGESFYTPPGVYSEMIAEAVTAETGVTPELSTTGGTSDARFIRKICPVIEFGLLNKTIHQVDEKVSAEDMRKLTAVYQRVLASFFRT